jgi:RHH-type proline utilization regulon transcriptional repressor/proline dehydrogenase/delta 1-pyrroline-5-carboxylate dehydrogenase
VQDDVADRVITMLKGAMAEYALGNPERLNTDIGPVIDEEAKGNIDRHIEKMRGKGRKVHQLARVKGEQIKHGTFVVPTLIELESFDELEREVFGPVLHVVRYNRAELDALLQQINDSGYGLTLGVHTRIDETIAQVVNSAKVGNLYVNRNIVGAVVAKACLALARKPVARCTCTAYCRHVRRMRWPSRFSRAMWSVSVHKRTTM